MTHRQAIWGLSNGALVFTVGGFAWVSLGLGLGLTRVVAGSGWVSLTPILSVVNLVVFLGLLTAALRLRRQATGFRLSEARHGDPATQRETARLSRAMAVMMLFEAAALALIGLVAARFQRTDLVPALVGLVLSLHFLPLASLFRVPGYYLTGAGGTVVAVIALAALQGPQRMVFLGYGLGIIAWGSAVYVIRGAPGIAGRLSGGPASRDPLSLSASGV